MRILSFLSEIIIRQKTSFPTLPNLLNCSEVQIHWKSSKVGHLVAIQVQALVVFIFHLWGRLLKNIIGPNPTYKNCWFNFFIFQWLPFEPL
jgi:hypothetical protein